MGYFPENLGSFVENSKLWKVSVKWFFSKVEPLCLNLFRVVSVERIHTEMHFCRKQFFFIQTCQKIFLAETEKDKIFGRSQTKTQLGDQKTSKNVSKFWQMAKNIFQNSFLDSTGPEIFESLWDWNNFSSEFWFPQGCVGGRLGCLQTKKVLGSIPASQNSLYTRSCLSNWICGCNVGIKNLNPKSNHLLARIMFSNV